MRLHDDWRGTAPAIGRLFGQHAQIGLMLRLAVHGLHLVEFFQRRAAAVIQPLHSLKHGVADLSR